MDEATESTYPDSSQRFSFYRVGSVGQDGQVALWDIEIEDDIPISPMGFSLGGR